MYAVANKTMRASDKAAIDGNVSGRELMLRAANALYDAVADNNKEITHIFCGCGNNGGDGYALAVLMHKNNRKCKVYGLAPTTADANYYYQECLNIFGDKLFALDDSAHLNYDLHNALAVDCLYGSGYRGELSERMSQVTSVINNHGTVISCDVPSGLSGDSGLADSCAVKADLTIAIGSLKLGHLLNDGKDYCGVIKVADIGIEIIGEKYKIIDNDDCRKCFPKRLNNVHKGSFGKVKIIACSECYVGAGILAAASCVNVLGESALSVGAGLCSLNVPDDMLSSLWGRALHCTLEKRSKLCLGDSVIAYGMGVGLNCNLLPRLLKQNMPLLIDADGLTELSENLELLKAKNCEVLLTPHPAEMGRLTGFSAVEILANPVGIAQDFAKRYGVTVLLKGCTTVVTDGDKTAIVTDGSPAMAKGGSGDTLSGVIAGLIAKGNGVFESASVGACIAGRAGELAAATLTEDTVKAMDAANCVRDVIKQVTAQI